MHGKAKVAILACRFGALLASVLISRGYNNQALASLIQDNPNNFYSQGRLVGRIDLRISSPIFIPTADRFFYRSPPQGFVLCLAEWF